MFNPETYHAALFARLKRLSWVKYASRRPEDLGTIGQVQMPALFVFGGSGAAYRSPPLPPQWTLTAGVAVAVRQDGATRESPETQLFAYLAQINDALQLQAGEVNADDSGTNLGGLVEHAWIVDYAIEAGTKDQLLLTATVEMLAIPLP